MVMTHLNVFDRSLRWRWSTEEHGMLTPGVRALLFCDPYNPDVGFWTSDFLRVVSSFRARTSVLPMLGARDWFYAKQDAGAKPNAEYLEFNLMTASVKELASIIWSRVHTHLRPSRRNGEGCRGHRV